MELKNITAEQQEKLAACETVEDVLALAKEEGVELSEKQLQEIAGGRTSKNPSGSNPWRKI